MVLPVDATFQIDCYYLVWKYAGTRMRDKSSRKGVIGSLDLCVGTFLLSIKLFQLMEEYDDDPFLGLLAFALGNEIDFIFASKSLWSPSSYKYSILFDLMAFMGPGQTSVTHAAVPVRY